MDNLLKVENLIRAGQLNNNPHLVAEYKAKLAGEFSFFMGLLEDILTRKPSWWVAQRKEYKSDSACDKSWEMTEDGINEMGLRLRIKRCEKLINALGTLLKVVEMEIKNI